MLFQRYLYDCLDKVERVQLHHDVGEVLEALYGGDSGEIAPQLARHFDEAGVVDKAIQYLQLAGEQAVRQTANLEAIGHLRRALELLATLPESPDRDHLELRLQNSLHVPLISTLGWGADDVGQAAQRAYELSSRVADAELVAMTLVILADYYLGRAEYRLAAELCTRILEMARAGGNDVLTAFGEFNMGYQKYLQGDLEGARPLFESVVDRDCTNDPTLAYVTGMDPRVCCLMHQSAISLYLGYPDAARHRISEAEERARRIDHPVSESMIPWAGWVVATRTGDDQSTRRFTDWLSELVSEHGNPVLGVCAHTYRALEQARRDPSGPARTPKLVAQLEATGWLSFESAFHICVALEQVFLGNASEALAAFDAALELIKATGERLFESWVHLGQGQLLAATGSVDQAEACLEKAIAVARGQHARFPELVAATALARLWQAQGKRREALELLRPVYDWFTEGFDTVPLSRPES